MGTIQGQQVHFVLVDDDDVSNMLAKNIINRHIPSAVFSIYTSPEDALTYLETITAPAILLLDINMPTLSGWEVLAKIQQFSLQTISLLSIYILSSSIDIEDRERAENVSIVMGYLEKPLSTASINQHFATLNANL